MLENDVDAFAAAAEAHADYARRQTLFSSKAGRALFTTGILSDVKKEEKKKGSAKVTFGRMQTLGAGAETFLLPVTVTLLARFGFRSPSASPGPIVSSRHCS